VASFAFGEVRLESLTYLVPGGTGSRTIRRSRFQQIKSLCVVLSFWLERLYLAFHPRSSAANEN